jgi:hypothetical protein
MSRTRFWVFENIAWKGPQISPRYAGTGWLRLSKRTNEDCGAAPPAHDRPPMAPALPGRADVGRPSGPGWNTRLCEVHSLALGRFFIKFDKIQCFLFFFSFRRLPMGCKGFFFCCSS